MRLEIRKKWPTSPRVTHATFWPSLERLLELIAHTADDELRTLAGITMYALANRHNRVGKAIAIVVTAAITALDWAFFAVPLPVGFRFRRRQRYVAFAWLHIRLLACGAPPEKVTGRVGS